MHPDGTAPLGSCGPTPYEVDLQYLLGLLQLVGHAPLGICRHPILCLTSQLSNGTDLKVQRPRWIFLKLTLFHRIKHSHRPPGRQTSVSPLQGYHVGVTRPGSCVQVQGVSSRRVRCRLYRRVDPVRTGERIHYERPSSSGQTLRECYILQSLSQKATIILAETREMSFPSLPGVAGGSCSACLITQMQYPASNFLLLKKMVGSLRSPLGAMGALLKHSGGFWG